MVMVMDTTERLARIAELQRANELGAAEVERRQATRDPAAELEEMIAEHGSAPQRSPPVIIYRRFDGNASAPASEPGADWSGWEAWMAGHIAILRTEMHDTMREALGIVVAEVSREMQAEIAELHRRLDSRDERDRTVAERSGRVAELQRENAIARREAERSQFDQALAEYRARIDAIEVKVGMLLRFFGGELPRGWD
jgi:hypothetical protein